MSKRAEEAALKAYLEKTDMTREEKENFKLLQTEMVSLAFAEAIKRLVDRRLIIIDSWNWFYDDEDERLKAQFPNAHTEHIGFSCDTLGGFYETFREEYEKQVKEKKK